MKSIDSPETFEHEPRTRLIVGPGELERLGEVAAGLGGKRVLVVSDPGVEAAGHTRRGLESLGRAKLETFLFTGVEENPTTEHVDAGVEVARKQRVDLIVGLGGGSSMDCAKGINFIFSCGGKMHDYWGVGKATSDLLPMVAVPTTAGTGSEMQSFALIADARTHQKMACGDRRAAFRAAILDPEVTLSQPPPVAAATGLDALSHAVETFVTRKANVLSRAFSWGAWRLLERHFATVLTNPENLEARSRMQLGAALAGQAIENSMLGAAHAAANPLTAHHGVVHGNAVGILLPHVVRFNAPAMQADYAELAAATDDGDLPGTAEGLARRLEKLLAASRLPQRLRDWDVEPRRFEELATEAAAQWTARFNPRPVEAKDFVALYEAAF